MGWSKVKKYRLFVLIIMIFCIWFYFMFLRVQAVIYEGANENWEITVHAQLTGTEGSNKIIIQYKGDISIYLAEYKFHPHYGGGIILSEETNNSIQQRFQQEKSFGFDANGVYESLCRDNCGYYDDEENLLFFIHWKGSQYDEGDTELIKLTKVRK